MLCKELILGVSEFRPPKEPARRSKVGPELCSLLGVQTSQQPFRVLFSFSRDNYGTRICQRSPLASASFAGALGAEQSHTQSGVTTQAANFSNPALPIALPPLYFLLLCSRARDLKFYP